MDPEDHTIIDAAARGLKEEVGLDGKQFKQLCSMNLDQYRVRVFCCKQWSGKPRPAYDDIIGVAWFTLAEIYALGQSLTPFASRSLMYLSYLLQHYDSHPDEWHGQWRMRGGNG